MPRNALLPSISPSIESGWVLAFALVFLLALQLVALTTVHLVRSTLKSARTFHSILTQDHPTEATCRESLHPLEHAPEGWDHAYFATELMERISGRVQSLSWRVTLREQPAVYLPEVILARSRPYLVILIDDSESMNWSGSRQYDEQRVYLRNNAGEVRENARDALVEDFVVVPEGTLFRGVYGNRYLKAPFAAYMQGAMPFWTESLAYVQNLCDEMDLCEIALATTSRGIVVPFTHESEPLAHALEDIHPSASRSPLAEAVYTVLDILAEPCATERHLLLVTDGYALDDGNLPEWLRDFDGDGDVSDSHIPGMGSHCLDDMAAYDASLNVRFHVMGPSNAFIQATVSQGGGELVPGFEAFVPLASFTSQTMAVHENTRRYLINTRARFDPDWVCGDAGAWYSARDGALRAQPEGSIRGVIVSAASNGPCLYAVTSRDILVSIDLPTGEAHWALQGVGGRLQKRGDTLLAGPNAAGEIHVLKDGPRILWKTRGELYAASISRLYVARAREIVGLNLPTGEVTAQNTTGSPITALCYDPCEGVLAAGSATGLIYLYDADLRLLDTLAVDQSTAVQDIHTFRWRKALHLLVLGDTHLACLNADGVVWSADVRLGTVSGALIADGTIYLTTWQVDTACPGIDAGRSHLTCYRAIDGQILSQVFLHEGRTFGPRIDLSRGTLEYLNWRLDTYHEDISRLTGSTFAPLGLRILAQSAP